MTEQETPAVMPEQEIEFEGRTVWVRMPRPEQLLVWKRTLRQIQEADTSAWNGEQAMKALERARMIVDSLLVHETDKDWLDDEMLAGRLDLKQVSQIVQKSVEAFAAAAEAEKAANGTRAEKRAAKKAPAKKASRKAPAR